MNNLNKPHSVIKLGLDFGTSGLRAAVVKNDLLLNEFSVPLAMPQRTNKQSEQSTQAWLDAFEQLFDLLKQAGLTTQINHIVADATSSTVLLSDPDGVPLTPALMYDDQRAQVQAQAINQLAPSNTAAQGASSTLAKVMWLTETLKQTAIIQHQIDWLNFQLCGVLGTTDENNALKLGYDSLHQAWPDWVTTLCPLKLPNVVKPGETLGLVTHNLVERWGFNPECVVHAGTTDSIAAFLASGANAIGDAVSALGSTIALKILSDRAIFAPEYGIYSHKLGDNWLVGGASNTGGAVLLNYFNLAEINALITQLDMTQSSGLACYPLTRPGERFPIADPNLAPTIPATQTRAELLKVLIEGLVQIESDGYNKLHQLGAPKPQRIFAVGGGNQNQAWSQLRQLKLPAKLANPISQAAAYGVTRLIKI